MCEVPSYYLLGTEERTFSTVTLTAFGKTGGTTFVPERMRERDRQRESGKGGGAKPEYRAEKM